MILPQFLLLGIIIINALSKNLCVTKNTTTRLRPPYSCHTQLTALLYAMQVF